MCLRSAYCAIFLLMRYRILSQAEPLKRFLSCFHVETRYEMCVELSLETVISCHSINGHDFVIVIERLGIVISKQMQ